MNTGERLTSLSGLSPRSAFDHFVAIVTGGTGKTVFASQMMVVSETTESVIAAVPMQKTVSLQDKESMAITRKGRRSDLVERETLNIMAFIPVNKTFINLATKREVRRHAA